MAVASAGPYANNLHLTPHPHLINQFLQPDALHDAQPTVSKHWRHMLKLTTKLICLTLKSDFLHFNVRHKIHTWNGFCYRKQTKYNCSAGTHYRVNEKSKAETWIKRKISVQQERCSFGTVNAENVPTDRRNTICMQTRMLSKLSRICSELAWMRTYQ